MIKIIILSAIYGLSFSTVINGIPWSPIGQPGPPQPPIQTQTVIQPPPPKVTEFIQIAQPHVSIPIPSYPITPVTPGQPDMTYGVIPPPPDMAYGAYGQLCGIRANAVCLSSTGSTTASQFMNCERDFSCCLCREITCNECISFTAGNSGVFGVQTITVNGRPENNGGGAEIILQGTESAMNSVISSTNIKAVVVTGVFAAKNAKITITNPLKDFKIYCTGVSSCEGLDVEIIFPAADPTSICDNEPFHIGFIDCSGPESCKNMQLTIRNDGCNPVLVDNLECTELDSCLSAHFDFIGDVETLNCDLGPSGHTATGLSSCYQNLQAFLCQDPMSCRSIRKTLTNPNNWFTMECAAAGSCQGAQLQLNFDTETWLDPITGTQFQDHIHHLSGFKFLGEASGALATVVINNEQNGKMLTIVAIECASLNSCAQTTFIIGKNVEINTIMCRPRTCDGCLVKVLPTDIGVPCTDFTPIAQL